MATMARDLQNPADERWGSLRAERGAGLVEYALLIALILLVCISSIRVFGVTNGGSINKTASTYSSTIN